MLPSPIGLKYLLLGKTSFFFLLKLGHICILIWGFEPHFNTQFELESASASLWKGSCEFDLLRGRHKTHCQLGLHCWVGFWAPPGCWQAEVPAPCVVSTETGLQEWCPCCLSGLFWHFVIASQRGMGTSSSSLSPHCCRWGHTASYVFWLIWNSYYPKGFPPVLCPSFYVAVLCELLKEAFLFQAVGVFWLWASLCIKLKRPGHNSWACHFSSPRILRQLVSLHLSALCTVPRAFLHLNVECGMSLWWECWSPGNCSFHLALWFLRAIHVDRWRLGF